jgi:hypothetical protein
MLDLSHIPNSQQDIKIFYSIDSTNAWQTWQKPRKCQYVWIMCIGGAGGGAGANNNQNSSYYTGGGSGAVTRALFNASYLPDTLYVQVGLGGAGGIGGQGSSTAGSAGTRSFVSIAPNTTATNVVQCSGNTPAAGGTAGTGTNAAGETGVSATTNAIFLSLSNFTTVSGVTAIGAAQLQAPDLVPLTSQIVTAGGGGSSYNGTTQVSYNGSSILSSSISPLIQGGTGVNTPLTNGGRGADGITSWKPFFSTGGAGGGASVSGSGGNGGNGGIGSGGGGGGGGSTANAQNGGNGGKGGDGLVIIISF